MSHGDTLETTVTISNTGNSVLEWNAPLLYESQDRDDTQNPDIGFILDEVVVMVLDQEIQQTSETIKTKGLKTQIKTIEILLRLFNLKESVLLPVLRL